MADTKISALTAIASLATGDLVAVVDDPAGTPVTKKATVDQIGDYVRSEAATAELIRDTIGTALVAGSGISITPVDGSDTITVAADGTAITALSAIASVAGEDVIPIVDDPSGTPTTKKATIDQVKTYMGANTHDIWIPVGSMTPRITSGAAWGSAETSTNKNNRLTLDFDASSAEYAQFFWRMPKSWNESTVTFIPIWSHPSTATNFGVVWKLSGVAISNDDALDAAQGTVQSSTDTGGTTDDIYAGPESSAITIGGTPAEGDYVTFEVSRDPADGSDTMAVDARLHGLILRIVTNALTDA